MSDDLREKLRAIIAHEEDIDAVLAVVDVAVDAELTYLRKRRDYLLTQVHRLANEGMQVLARALVAEREAAALRAGVEALLAPGFIPGPAILCQNPGDRDGQWRQALRALLAEHPALR